LANKYDKQIFNLSSFIHEDDFSSSVLRYGTKNVVKNLIKKGGFKLSLVFDCPALAEVFSKKGDSL
jgi:hypothetical protein